MFRILACLSLFAVTSSLAAQTPPGDAFHLTLSPAPLPTPSLKYRLLPDTRDLEPGNAATIYYRSESLLVENMAVLEEMQEDHWDRWFTAPLKEFPRTDVEVKLPWMRNLLHEIELATHYRQCDWEVDGRAEDAGLLSPDLRGFRRVGVILGVRARYHVERKRFPEALASLQIGYALARHLGQGPSLNHVLVGEVVANLMNHQLEEFIQQPGTPNLYWSLTVLPRPYFDPEAALDEEGTALLRTWPWLKQVEGGLMTPSQVGAARDQIQKNLDRYGLSRPAEKLLEETLPEAKRTLLGQGLTEEQVRALPPFQAVALYALREHRRTWEEYAKWFRLPGGCRQPACKEAVQKYQQAIARLDRLFFGGLVRSLEIGAPAHVEKVYAARERFERDLAVLRCLEALRLHAVGHEGKLPVALKDISEVPVPIDPVSGKPFSYEATGDRARLGLPVARGEEPAPGQKRIYEVTLSR